MSNTLTMRRAMFVYEAAKLAAIEAKAPVIPIAWNNRETSFREQFLHAIEQQCGHERSSSPEELHESWMRAYLAMGWTFDELYDRESKKHPDLVSYAELCALERDKDAVFIALCDIARLWIRDDVN